MQDGPVVASLAAAEAAGGSSVADDAPALDEDDAAIYKKRIVDLLMPGESVLLALRRLGERNGWWLWPQHFRSNHFKFKHQHQE
jgi:hypothetical protein